MHPDPEQAGGTGLAGGSSTQFCLLQLWLRPHAHLSFSGVYIKVTGKPKTAESRSTLAQYPWLQVAESHLH